MQDDKKKLAVLGLLVVVVLAIGAFQFTRSASTPAPAPKKTEEASAKKTDEELAKAADEEPFFAAALPQRDPFQPQELDAFDPTEPISTDPPQPSRPTAARLPRASSVPPYKPFGDKLPEAWSEEGSQIQAAPEPEPQFGYRVSGLMIGKRPVAVFTDSQGVQRLVPLGASIDGDSKVVGIDKGRVTVSFRGKLLMLSPGGNPNAK